MKTTSDLNALIPTIARLLAENDHEIGNSYYEQDEDGWGLCCEYADNSICYEDDGWLIEVSYKCCGEWDNDPGDYWTPPSSDLRKAWGEVTEITAYHYDEATDEETTFEGDDLDELWAALCRVLESI